MRGRKRERTNKGRKIKCARALDQSPPVQNWYQGHPSSLLIPDQPCRTTDNAVALLCLATTLHAFTPGAGDHDNQAREMPLFYDMATRDFGWFCNTHGRMDQSKPMRL